MIFRQLFDHVSSTYSYLLASRPGGEALIIDPVLEKVDRYLNLVHELDLKLVKAVDTHLHADHITGLGALRDHTHCITVMGEQTKADVVSMRLSDGDKLTIEGLSLDDFRATMETNYFGPLRTIRAWLPDMRQRQSGCIINITSVAGKIACSPLTPYAATKFALEALSEGLAQEVKPFNIRVAIVEPGIIDTQMARNIENAPTDAAYPQVRRFGHMFEASLDNPTPPALVAEKIREIIESGTFKLRHPVGPDAEAFLAWRASLNDEQWVEWGALPDDAWYERVANDFGLDARSKRKAKDASITAIRATA